MRQDLIRKWSHSAEFARAASERLLDMAVRAKTIAFEDACLKKAEEWEQETAHFEALIREESEREARKDLKLYMNASVVFDAH